MIQSPGKDFLGVVGDMQLDFFVGDF